MNYDVAVVGAGPAGLLAALFASKKGRVLLLEHNDRVGRKILSTGNGKCNLTNMNMDAECYRTSGRKDFYRVIEDFGPSGVREFFMSAGVMTVERDGYVYPASMQAQTVLDALSRKARNTDTTIHLSENVTAVTPSAGGYSVTTDKAKYNARYVILANGGKASPVLGSDGSGFAIAQKLGHSIVKPIPALVQLKCREPFLKQLSGVRSKAKVSLFCGEKLLACDYGEVQFTDYGLSGIVIFQISSLVKRLLDKSQKPVVSLDLLCEYDEAELSGIFSDIRRNNPDYDNLTLLSGLFNKKIAKILAAEKDDAAIIRRIKNFCFSPCDTNGFDNAQVCAGGVDTSEINFDTMESRLHKGLFFAGEIVDVDGICGGYNLTWAFASGRLAGMSAGESIR